MKTNNEKGPCLVSVTQVRHEFLDVTPAMASNWLANAICARPLNPGKVAHLALDMSLGLWRSLGDGDDIAQLVFDVKGNLIDGRHCLAATVQSARTIRFLVIHLG